jgi:hypothetical protein
MTNMYVYFEVIGFNFLDKNANAKRVAISQGVIYVLWRGWGVMGIPRPCHSTGLPLYWCLDGISNF